MQLRGLVVTHLPSLAHVYMSSLAFFVSVLCVCCVIVIVRCVSPGLTLSFSNQLDKFTRFFVGAARTANTFAGTPYQVLTARNYIVDSDFKETRDPHRFGLLYSAHK